MSALTREAHLVHWRMIAVGLMIGAIFFGLMVAGVALGPNVPRGAEGRGAATLAFLALALVWAGIVRLLRAYAAPPLRRRPRLEARLKLAAIGLTCVLCAANLALSVLAWRAVNF